MKTFEYTITDELGIHARPAGQLVKLSKEYKSTITLTKGDKIIDAKKVFGVMGANVKTGDTIVVTINGPDEEESLKILQAFFSKNL